MSVAVSSKTNTIDSIKMIVTIGAPLAIMLIPINEVFTAQLKLYFAVTLAAVLAFAFENFN